MVRPEMPYVVEVVDLGGRVIAVGDVIIAHAGDVAAATVAVPARRRWPLLASQPKEPDRQLRRRAV